jgi:hypothetical protein
VVTVFPKQKISNINDCSTDFLGLIQFIGLNMNLWLKQSKTKVKDASFPLLIFLWTDAYLLMADADNRNM